LSLTDALKFWSVLWWYSDGGSNILDSYFCTMPPSPRLQHLRRTVHCKTARWFDFQILSRQPGNWFKAAAWKPPNPPMRTLSPTRTRRFADKPAQHTAYVTLLLKECRNGGWGAAVNHRTIIHRCNTIDRKWINKPRFIGVEDCKLKSRLRAWIWSSPMHAMWPSIDRIFTKIGGLMVAVVI
jgi:hypothetical protein